MKKLRVIDLAKVALRLTLLQSTWSEGGMQTVGLAYCLLPARRKLNPAPAELALVMRQHQEPFNTHPFLVGAVAGAMLRLEEEGRAPREIAAFLRATMGPLAAVGDPFFRGALPVFAACLSGLVAIQWGVLAGIITLLITSNSFHFLVRVFGIFAGYREGYNVLNKVTHWLQPSRTELTNHLAAALAGIVLITAVRQFGPTDPAYSSLLFGAAGVLIAFGLIKWKSLQNYALPAALIICLLVGVIS